MTDNTQDLIYIDKETEDRLVAAVTAKFDALPESSRLARAKWAICHNICSDQMSAATSLLYQIAEEYEVFGELKELFDKYDDNCDHQAMESDGYVHSR